MSAAVLLLHLAAATLGAAGAGKLLAPAATARALDALRPGAGRRARPFGGVELGLAAAAIVVGGRLMAGALAVTYVALLGFSWHLRRRAPGVPCGCFGASDTPPSRVHLVLDVGLAGAAAAAAVQPVPGLSRVLADLGWWSVPYVELVGVATLLVVLAGTLLDDVLHAIATVSTRPAGR